MSIRHPHNPKLHLFDDHYYNGLPVMRGKGPFITEYLDVLQNTIALAQGQYRRVLAYRVDLHFPKDMDITDYLKDNQAISRFIESYKAKIEHNRAVAMRDRPYAHDTKVRYVWTREFGQAERPHYHLLFMLNGAAYYTVGNLNSSTPNMISRMQEAWASATGLPVGTAAGLIHIPENSTYRLDREDQAMLAELHKRASYLCKAATKVYGNRARGFSSSRG
ncbi:inovirus Gp2 family protein [Pseudomonas massiliensis]|uniref:inovirus Gp2 family protein n=1 Tax=Pseudomonas massiliensis TaxID=522492 RepID=UPI00058BE767|nr:inovirus Gp2 family protein [Pseudomonas massiliensis]